MSERGDGVCIAICTDHAFVVLRAGNRTGRLSQHGSLILVLVVTEENKLSVCKVLVPAADADLVPGSLSSSVNNSRKIIAVIECIILDSFDAFGNGYAPETLAVTEYRKV